LFDTIVHLQIARIAFGKQENHGHTNQLLACAGCHNRRTAEEYFGDIQDVKVTKDNATLHARDIEEKETACRFDKMTCRWTLLGDADQVHNSGERAAIISALANGGSEGMHISEIIAATERNDRNAVEQLLFKMQRDRELVRIKRGLYALPGKIGKKERNEAYPSGK
jgi:hypothetical protein